MSLTIEGKYGRFLNAADGHGWDAHIIATRGILFPQTIYEFTLLYPHPLTWHDYRDGRYYRYDQHFATNFGSIPWPLRATLPQSQYPRSYSGHDSTWAHGGIYVSDVYRGVYEFMPLTRRQGNQFLFRWVDTEGGTIRKYPIRWGVGIGAVAAGARDWWRGRENNP